MPGPFESPLSATATAAAAPPPGLGFSVYSEKVDLDFDFVARAVRGRAEIIVQPHSKDFGHVRLNCRQARIHKVTVEGREAKWEHNDPHSHIYLSSKSTVHHHETLRQKVEDELDGESEDLVIAVPRRVQIRELDAFSGDALGSLLDTTALRAADEGGPVFAPLKVVIDYEIKSFRDGLHFAGLEEGDTRYPHVYTRNSQFPGTACCLFPCVDDGSSRCPWDISIRCPRTLGDAFRKPTTPLTNGVNGPVAANGVLTNGLTNGVHADEDIHMTDADSDGYGLAEEDKALEIIVICSGDMTDDIVDPKDPSRKTVTFSCAMPVAPQHIALAIGPFDHEDLSDLRESDDDEMMGQAAIRVHGFCLPGRREEVRNTCMALAKATDHFSKTYISYPFTSYKIVFVDDLVPEIAHSASLTLCNNSLLYPEAVLEPLFPVTRKLVHALASQWIGVNVIPRSPQDWWVIFATSHFMADDFMEQLCGRNEHRFRMKMMAQKVVGLDIDRPSLQDLGEYLALDPSEIEFMEVKAPLVMFILNQKIKRMAKMGVTKIIYKVLLQAKTGKLQNGSISTEDFIGIVDKYLESKPIPDFWRQWVYGAGCPHFYVTHRFNKKKSVIEFAIRQTQADKSELEEVARELDPASFMKEIKEQNTSMRKKKPTRVFTGAMTVTVHEADGTPYDHIIPIHDATTRFDAPYNTKYTRLKRNRRQKERAAAAAGIDISGEGEIPDEVPLYCLGDVLDSDKDLQDWDFDEWSPEDESQISGEQYEWVRVDADFEWICKISFSQPLWMNVAQLQQDPDVVAQTEALQALAQQKPSKLISTFLTRTLMDRRYFHGIRTMAAEALANCAAARVEDVELDWVGLFHLEKAFQELFCLPGSQMVRSNDFSDRSQYLVQCAIPRAIAKVREPNGRGLMRARRWILDKLKFNDNSHNTFSDCHYVATLLSCLAETLTYKDTTTMGFDFEDDEQDDHDFQKEAINEIERHRRLDEWIPSYQNIVTITALECQRLLMENNIIPRKMLDFLQYTKPGAAELVRLKAMECLVDLNMLRHPAILRYLIFSLAYDPSPYVREQLYHMIGRGIGRIAIGDKGKEDSNQDVGGLVIEQEASTDSRAAMIERTQTLEGATKALKVELGSNEVLKEQLRKALTSPLVSLKEWGQLLEICALIYDPKFSLSATIRYPFYWSVQHLGKGKMRFFRNTRRRTKSIKKIKEEQAATVAHAVAEKRKRNSVSDEPNKRQHIASSANNKPNGASMSLKLSLGMNKNKNAFTPPSTAISPGPSTKPLTLGPSIKPPPPSPIARPHAPGAVQKAPSPFVKPTVPTTKTPTAGNSRAPTPSSVVSDKPEKPKMEKPKPEKPKLEKSKPEKSRPEKKQRRRRIVVLKVNPARLAEITARSSRPASTASTPKPQPQPQPQPANSSSAVRVSQPIAQRERHIAPPKQRPEANAIAVQQRPQTMSIVPPPPSASPPAASPPGEQKPGAGLKLKLKLGTKTKNEGQ